MFKYQVLSLTKQKNSQCEILLICDDKYKIKKKNCI